MLSEITSAAIAGSIVRRVREDQGISRSTLAARAGIGARTLYALEAGESTNFGLSNYLRVLDALGLSLAVIPTDGTAAGVAADLADEQIEASADKTWNSLADIWRLGDRCADERP